MEKRYGRQSPLPSHQTKLNSSFSTPSYISRIRSRLAVYIIATIFTFLIITHGLPIQLSAFYSQYSLETARTESAHAKSNQTGLVPLEAHVSTYISELLALRLPYKTCVGRKRTFLLPRPVSQPKPLFRRSNADTKPWIVSKCPDAKICLEELVVPAMEQVVDLVSFRLSYIGSIDDNDTLRTSPWEIES